MSTTTTASTTADSSSTRSAREDVYTRVTNSIVESLEKGVRPWLRPWAAGNTEGRIIRPLRHNGQKYSGVNILTLWMASELNGYTSPFFMTFQQAKELGGYVKKGEHGSPVVYASTFKKTEENDAGEAVERELRFLREYTVFNADQVANLPAHFYAPLPKPPETMQRIERAEQFFANTKIEVRHGGCRAYYAVEADYIQMPPFETFRDAESYVSTRGHETVHATRHPSRLNREFGRKTWGDDAYAFEELVAELGSAFLCADLQITPEVREDHSSYIQSWLKVLRDDKRCIFSAASHASKAVDYLHGLQPPSAA